MDPKPASTITEDKVLKHTGLPRHSILAVVIDLDVTAQRVMKLKKLPQPPESSLHVEEQQQLAQGMWDSLDKHCRRSRGEGNTAAFWATWT